MTKNIRLYSFAICVVLATVIITLYFSTDHDSSYLGLRIAPAIAGIAFLTYFLRTLLHDLNAASRGFEKIDEKRSAVGTFDIDAIIAKIDDDSIPKNLRLTLQREFERQLGSASHRNTTSIGDSFGTHLARVIPYLEQQSQVSDRKASALLDKGVASSWLSVIVFIASIVAWQIVAWLKGIGPQLYMGAASSALLFVFLQFLSSWFLKQYRHFVEVSTYLIEIKSVFDRYHLLYMIATENDGTTGTGQPGTRVKAFDSLVEALREEMKWPRVRPTFTKDTYAAKDAMASQIVFMKALKDLVGSSDKRDK